MIDENSPMPWGKYQGNPLKDLPIPYVEWVLKNGNPLFKEKEPDLYSALEKLLLKNEFSPWHPESDKPSLPFVICTNGEGHYWMGKFEYGCWLISHCWGWNRSDNIPIAWIEPDKFVPFVKNKPLHKCQNKENNSPITHCQQIGAHLYIFCNNAYWPISNCPFCGSKAAEK